MKLQNRLVAGRMNKDDDERLVPNGEFVHAENIRVSNSEGSNQGAAENVLGNKQLTFPNLGTNPITLGHYVDNFEDKIYWFVLDQDASNPHSWILEFDTRTDTLTVIMEDSRASGTNVLNFNASYLISGVDMVIDSDNDRRFLIWTDNYNPPRFINVDILKNTAVDSYSEDDVNLIKKPPISPPVLTLQKLGSGENNILEKFLAFSYRYRYVDQQYSVPSPFSEVAFEGKTFVYDYSTSSNEGMVNDYNAVKIDFETGPEEVVGIDLYFQEDGSNNLYLIESFDKALEGWADNQTASFVFTNNKNYTVAPSELFNLRYDAVPRLAEALAVIDSRIMLGNILENYNIENSDGESIKIDFSTSFVTDTIVEGTPTRSIKSNRNYELAIAYLDEYGRSTPPLTSQTNTVFIDNSRSVLRNRLRVSVNNLPPSWASYYRFYIKQNQDVYETIAPTIFYNDGVFIWVKMEGDDKNKIDEGDFLWVKSDTSGVLPEAKQVEVLEIKLQERNFLEETDKTNLSESDTIQEPGTYFRIKPTDFDLNLDDASVFRSTGRGFRSDSTRNNFTSNNSYFDDIVFVGTGGSNSNNDLFKSGTYSGSTDKRFLIEITAEGTPDTFKWSNDNGDTYTTGVSVNTSSVSLSDGLSVSWTSNTGHKVGDVWVISAKASNVVSSHNNDRSVWTCLQSKTTTNESIIGGSVIKLKYKEIRKANTRVEDDQASIIEDFEVTFTSTKDYANIEEWWYGDNIVSTIQYPSTNSKVFFRRGTPQKNPVQFLEVDESKNLYMIIESRVSYSGSEVIKVFADLEIIEYENSVIFETKPKDRIDGVFYELGDTYNITGGYHVGNQSTQTSEVSAISYLNAFNCISWGNGFESYKIRDKKVSKGFQFNFRAATTYENYRENRRSASVIYSEPYNQVTGFNGLNSFNTSVSGELLPYKDLDDKFGKITAIRSWNTNMLIWQEDQVGLQPINKNIIQQADGGEMVVQVGQVFGTFKAYAGEYGCQDPTTIANYNEYWYWIDTNRGKPLRLAGGGIEVINYGMRDYFRDQLILGRSSNKFGGYDPHNEEYVVTIPDTSPSVTNIYGCNSKLYKANQDNLEQYVYTVQLDSTTNQLTLDVNVSSGAVTVGYDFNGATGSESSITSTSTININTFSTFDVRTVTITVTPAGTSSYSIEHTCTNIDTNNYYFIFLVDKESAAALNTFLNSGEFFELLFSPNGVQYFGNTSEFLPVKYSISVDDPVAAFYKVEVKSTDNIYIDAANTFRLMVGVNDSVISDDFQNLFDFDKGHRFGHYYSLGVYGRGDVNTVVSLASFTTTGGVTGDFPNSRNYLTSSALSETPTNNKNLYLIWDMRTTSVTLDNSSLVLRTPPVQRGETLDINVLGHAILPTYTDVEVEVTTAPTSGTTQVLENGVIRYRNTATGAYTDSFVVTVSTGNASDTVTIIPQDSGTSTTGNTSITMKSSDTAKEAAESDNTNLTTYYHDGEYDILSLDDTVYTVSGPSSPLDGNNKWFRVPYVCKVVQIDSNGKVVQERWSEIDTKEGLKVIPG